MRSLPDDAMWAVTECAEAELGDLRRTQRVVALATVLAQRPGASLPEACGDRAPRKAAYRFFDNTVIDPRNLLDSHVDATLSRLAPVPLVLAVHDTTALDWTTHPATTGLGPLGPPAHRGLHVHTTLAFTPERVPLGLLAQQVWARDPNDVGKRATRKQRPIAEKESQQWLTSVEAVLAARVECPQTRFVSVGDREADVYDLPGAGAARRGGPADSSRLESLCHPAGALRLGDGRGPPRGGDCDGPGPPPRHAATPDRHPGGALVPPDPVPTPAPQARTTAGRVAVGCAGPGRGAPGGDGPHCVVVVDHLCGPHHHRGAHAGGLVCLSLGRGSLAQNFEKWLSHRSPPVGDRRAAATVFAAV